MEAFGRSSRSIGFVQKCGGSGTVFPRQLTTRVRISLILIDAPPSQIACSFPSIPRPRALPSLLRCFLCVKLFPSAFSSHSHFTSPTHCEELHSWNHRQDQQERRHVKCARQCKHHAIPKSV